jgi:hypothetical protein
VKSGGHNYAGFSQAEPSGFQIDMRAYLCYIRNATVEFGQPAIRVGAGCTFETVYTWLQSQSSPDYVLSGGFCPSVGVSGFVLSGGIGPLTRLFGMGVDQILEARMATVNGSSIVVANATINTDVYWALRGGGGGSFGVVTEWALKLHSLKDQHHFTYGEYCPPDGLASYNASLQQLARVLPTVPDWLTLSWRFTNAPNTPAYGLCYLYYGINSADTTYNWLVQSGLVPTATSPLLHYPGGHDINGDGSAKGHNGNFVTDYPTFLEMELANAEFKGYMQFSTYPAITHNCALSSFTQATIDALLAVWTAIPNGTLVSCDFQGLPLSQGAAGKVASSETAFEWRNFPYAADAECSWQTRGGEQAAKSWLDTFLPALQSIGQCPGSYLNFPWRGVPNFPQQYWGANTARLQQIRAVWNSDPKNSLRFEQQVPLP